MENSPEIRKTTILSYNEAKIVAIFQNIQSYLIKKPNESIGIRAKVLFSNGHSCLKKLAPARH